MQEQARDRIMDAMTGNSGYSAIGAERELDDLIAEARSWTLDQLEGRMRANCYGVEDAIELVRLMNGKPPLFDRPPNEAQALAQRLTGGELP